MKKIFITILTVLLSFLLLGCTKKNIKEIPYEDIGFTNLSYEYQPTFESLRFYYPTNDQTPYVDIKSFIKTLSSRGGPVKKLNYRYKEQQAGSQVTISIPTGPFFAPETVLIDTTTEELIFSSDVSDFMTADLTSPGGYDSYVKVNQEDVEQTAPFPTTIDLSQYDFDLIAHNEQNTNFYLLPFSIANHFFTGSYFYFYYNGDQLYSFDYFSMSTGNFNMMRESSFNQKESSLDFRQEAWNYYMMVFDYNYGLRDGAMNSNSIEYFKDYQDEFLSSDVNSAIALTKMVSSLDDLHSSIVRYGFTNSSNYTDSDVAGHGTSGPRTTNFYDARDFAVKDGNSKWLVTSQGGQNSVRSEVEYYIDTVNDDTAVIYLPAFRDSITDRFVETLQALKNNEKIKNVVLDLSLNTGGTIGLALEMLNVMSGQDIPYNIKNNFEGSSLRMPVYTTLPSFKDFNYYIVTSPITYSAANYFTALAQEMNLATIVGKNSSGGSCAIDYIVSPDGTVIVISSNTRLYGKNWENLEYGITVDIAFPNYTNLSGIIEQIKK